MAIGKPHLHTISDQDGAAILDVDRGMISALNPTGAFVWMRLERGDILESIIAELALETGEDPSVVDRDVKDFIKTLKENQILLD